MKFIKKLISVILFILIIIFCYNRFFNNRHSIKDNLNGIRPNVEEGSNLITTAKTTLENLINGETTDSNIEKLSAPPKDALKGVMVRDVDGDTIHVKLLNGAKMDIRLLLIDTPETHKPNTPVQKFGPEAAAFTASELPKGTPVYVEIGSTKKDKYNRNLAYVWHEQNGKWIMINEQLVSKGLARVAYVYNDKTYLNQLNILQDKAKKEKLNIWSKKGYVTDRGYDMAVWN